MEPEARSARCGSQFVWIQWHQRARDSFRPSAYSERVPDASAQSALKLDTKPPLQLLPLSARTETALTELARKYLQVFSEKPDLDLADVCHTAGMGRSHFEYRLAVVAADLLEAKERLGRSGAAKSTPGFEADARRSPHRTGCRVHVYGSRITIPRHGARSVRDATRVPTRTGKVR